MPTRCSALRTVAGRQPSSAATCPTVRRSRTKARRNHARLPSCGSVGGLERAPGRGEAPWSPSQANIPTRQRSRRTWPHPPGTGDAPIERHIARGTGAADAPDESGSQRPARLAAPSSPCSRSLRRSLATSMRGRSSARVATQGRATAERWRRRNADERYPACRRRGERWRPNSRPSRRRSAPSRRQRTVQRASRPRRAAGRSAGVDRSRRRLRPSTLCAPRGCRRPAPAPDHSVTLHIARHGHATIPNQSGGRRAPLDDEPAAMPADRSAPHCGSSEANSRPVEQCRRPGLRRPAQPPPPRARAPSPLPTVHHGAATRNASTTVGAVRFQRCSLLQHLVQSVQSRSSVTPGRSELAQDRHHLLALRQQSIAGGEQLFDVRPRE